MSHQYMRAYERFLLRVDQMPWAVAFRMALGYVVIPIWTQLPGSRVEWTLIPFFFVVLAAMRVALLVPRRVLGFSDAAKKIWLERRLMSKRVDSYQWQKLLWMGIGMSLHAFQPDGRFAAFMALTIFCLITGLIGLIIWLRTMALDNKPSGA
jgi:hypothetical protein